MEVIRLNLNTLHPFIDEGLAVALGQFDGLHIAHMELVNKAIELAKKHNTKSAILTFHPHPDFVLGKSDDFSLITPIKKKMELLDKTGLDYVFLLEFNKDVAAMKPELFVDEFLLGLNVKHAVCGFDFRYGEFGKGSAYTIREHSQFHITVDVITERTYHEQKIGTQLIEELLYDGDICLANKLLNRHYSLDGIVAHGRKLGRTIGIPTANIRLHDNYVLPKVGVYAVTVKLNGDTYQGMCNIGFNPTFNLALTPKIEVNIFDFDRDIYGKELKIYFHDRVRDEVKFPSKDALVAQLHEDRDTVKDILSNDKNCFE